MSKRTKVIFIIAVILLVYGYLCRLVNIFFFWDSQTFAWIIALFGLMFYFFDLIKTRKEKNQKNTWLKVGIGLIIFFLVLGPFIVIIIKNSAPYMLATAYLETNPALQKEVGEIKGFGLIPTGAVSSSTTEQGASSGQAAFSITVMGKLKYKDIQIYLEKTPETNWTVISVK